MFWSCAINGFFFVVITLCSFLVKGHANGVLYHRYDDSAILTTKPKPRATSQVFASSYRDVGRRKTIVEATAARFITEQIDGSI